MTTVPLLPDWSLDSHKDSVSILRLTRNDQTLGFVSVCLRRRDWEPGSVSSVRGRRRFDEIIPKRYRGRSWRVHLYHDAMQAVENIFKDEK